MIRVIVQKQLSKNFELQSFLFSRSIIENQPTPTTLLMQMVICGLQYKNKE